MVFPIIRLKKLSILILVFSLFIPVSHAGDDDVNHLEVLYPLVDEAPLVRHGLFIDFVYTNVYTQNAREVSRTTFYRLSIELLSSLYTEVRGLSVDESNEDLQEYLLQIYAQPSMAVALVDVLAGLLQEVHEKRATGIRARLARRSQGESAIKNIVREKLNQLISRAQSFEGRLRVSRPQSYSYEEIFQSLVPIFSSSTGQAGDLDLDFYDGFESVEAELTNLVSLLVSEFDIAQLQAYRGLSFRINDSVQVISQGLDNLQTVGSLYEVEKRIQSFDTSRYETSRSSEHCLEQAKQVRDFLSALRSDRIPMVQQLAIYGEKLEQTNEKIDLIERVRSRIVEVVTTGSTRPGELEEINTVLYYLIRNLNSLKEIYQDSIQRMEDLLPKVAVLEAKLGALATELEHRALNFDPETHSSESTRFIQRLIETFQRNETEDTETLTTDELNRRWLLDIYFGRKKDLSLDSQGALRIIVLNNYRSEELRRDLVGKLRHVISGNSLIYFRSYIELFPEDYSSILDIINRRMPTESDQRFNMEGQIVQSLMQYVSTIYNKYKSVPQHFVGLQRARERLSASRRFRKFPGTAGNASGYYLDELLVRRFQSEPQPKLTCEYHILLLSEQPSGENP